MRTKTVTVAVVHTQDWMRIVKKKLCGKQVDSVTRCGKPNMTEQRKENGNSYPFLKFEYKKDGLQGLD